MTLFPCAKHLVLGALLICGTVSKAMADTAVVVSSKSAVGSLNEPEVAAIFLGRGSDVKGGAVLMPLDQREDSPQRQDFYRRVIGKSPVQMKAYWSKIIFTGVGQPPREVDGDAAMKQVLGRDKSAIGYMDAGSVDASVKIVLLLR